MSNLPPILTPRRKTNLKEDLIDMVSDKLSRMSITPERERAPIIRHKPSKELKPRQVTYLRTQSTICPYCNK